MVREFLILEVEMKMLRSKFEHRKIRNLFFILAFLVLFPTQTLAGWESYPFLSDPSANDLVLVWDVSDFTLSPSGRTKYLFLSSIFSRTVSAHGSVSSGTETFSPGVHSITVSGNHTWEFTNWPAAGTEGVIRIYITNGGAGAVSFSSAIQWDSGTVPQWQISGEDVVTFTSIDGGVVVKGFSIGEDMK